MQGFNIGDTVRGPIRTGWRQVVQGTVVKQVTDCHGSVILTLRVEGKKVSFQVMGSDAVAVEGGA